MLLGPHAGVRRVALDPLSTKIGGEALVELVGPGRERFLQSLTGEHVISTSPLAFP